MAGGPNDENNTRYPLFDSIHPIHLQTLQITPLSRRIHVALSCSRVVAVSHSPTRYLQRARRQSTPLVTESCRRARRWPPASASRGARIRQIFATTTRGQPQVPAPKRATSPGFFFFKQKTAYEI